MSRILALLLFLALVLPVHAADDTPVPASTPSGSLSVQAPTKTVALKPDARVVHPPLDEISGIIPSLRTPGAFWVHNDSGAIPSLYAIRADGTLITTASKKRWVGTAEPGKEPYTGIDLLVAANVDWEDIARDGDTLYVLDTGNNDNARRDLGVYVVPEPNPAITTKMRPLAWLPIAWPDQRAFPPEPKDRHFDCEAGFVHGGDLYFLTKHRVGQLPAPGTRLYRLDTRHADRPNVLTLLDEQRNLGGWVTAADVSPDGQTLAVLCHAPQASIWLFELQPRVDRMLHGRARRLVVENAGQCEALCWVDSGTLLMVNEEAEMFRIPLSWFPEW